VFRIDVAKVDQYIANIAMAIHVCYNIYVPNVSYVFQKYFCKYFVLTLYMFHTYVASVFIWMLHMFCNDISSFLRVFFASVLDLCFKCFICLRRTPSVLVKEVVLDKVLVKHWEYKL
jgi:hypothetical protein